MNGNTTAKLLGLALWAANLLPAADGAEIPVSQPWVETLAVLIFSFALAAVAGFLIDAWFKKPDKARPGVDAYIDQMLMGNGTHLRGRGR